AWWQSRATAPSWWASCCRCSVTWLLSSATRGRVCGLLLGPVHEVRDAHLGRRLEDILAEQVEPRGLPEQLTDHDARQGVRHRVVDAAGGAAQTHARHPHAH